MTEPIRATGVYQGGAIRLDTPLPSLEGQRVTLVIQPAAATGIPASPISAASAPTSSTSGRTTAAQPQTEEHGAFVIGFGADLAVMANPPEARMAGHIRALRTKIHQTTGVTLGPVRLQVHAELPRDSYAVFCNGSKIGESKAWIDRSMVLVNDPMERVQLTQFQGHAMNDPVGGYPCIWTLIPSAMRANHLGLKVIPADAAVSAHVEELFLQHIGETITKAIAEDMLRHASTPVRETAQAVIPNLISITAFSELLSALLRQRNSVIDLGAILQAVRTEPTASSSVWLAKLHPKLLRF